jgi:hypothetical protein
VVNKLEFFSYKRLARKRNNVSTKTIHTTKNKIITESTICVMHISKRKIVTKIAYFIMDVFKKRKY